MLGEKQADFSTYATHFSGIVREHRNRSRFYSMQPTSTSPVVLESGARAAGQAEPLVHQAIHDTVVEVLEKLPRGALLDVPAGQGELAARLIAKGFDVRCCDLYPEIFRLDGVEIRRGNLNGELPFDDRSFGYVTCLEGLEHIENPQQAIREFARLLQPGGQLVVSVPNILNIEERLKWLVYGYTSHFKPITREQSERLRAEYDNREAIVAHVNPIGYSELRYILEKNGFQIVSLHRDKPKARAWLYWPMVVLIRLIAWLTPATKRAERWTEELASKEVLLGGNTLIVHAVLEEVVTP
jgi:2-polyprenyl-3-methyl-5-hydroxy-6-metoxy-1,4-benzoquinol methylase